MSLSRSFLISTLLLCVLCVSRAHAKKVSLTWKPIEGAIGYDLVVQSSEGTSKSAGVTLKKSLTEPKWSGSLTPGAYLYQMRGIDRVKRPGQWSAWTPLAVMPPPVELRAPSDGTTLKVYTTELSLLLKWDAAEGANQYHVEIMKDGHRHSTHSVQKTELELKDLPVGSYRWQVKAVLKLSKKVAGQEKTWDSAWTQDAEFKIQLKKLEAPELSQPLGTQVPPENQRLDLKWDVVDGAEGYEVHITHLKKGVSGDGVKELKTSKYYFTKDHKLTVRVAEDGKYKWGVRALAHVDAQHHAKATGPESMGDFNLERNAVYTGDLGYVAFSLMMAPYNYQIINAATGFQGTTKSVSVVSRLSGEYWIRPLWAVAAAVEAANFEISGQSFYRPAIELTGKYRTQLSSGQYAWSISPKLGFELRDYNEVIPTSNTANSSVVVKDYYALGLGMGVDVRKQFSEKLGLGMKMGYFLPVSLLSGTSGSAIGDSVSSRNISVGLQGLYWLNPTMAIGAGGYFEMRSLGIVIPNTGGKVEKIMMDGSYFFGSFVYRFLR